MTHKTAESLSDLYLQWSLALALPSDNSGEVDQALVASLEQKIVDLGGAISGSCSEPVAALTAARRTRKWNPLLHPRGRDGRFIHKFGWIKGLFRMGDVFPESGNSNEKRDFHAKVLEIIPDPKSGKTNLRVQVGRGKGRRETFIQADQVVSAKPPKAYIDSTPPDIPDLNVDVDGENNARFRTNERMRSIRETLEGLGPLDAWDPRGENDETLEGYVEMAGTVSEKITSDGPELQIREVGRRSQGELDARSRERDPAANRGSELSDDDLATAIRELAPDLDSGDPGSDEFHELLDEQYRRTDAAEAAALDRWYELQEASDVDSFGAVEARELTDEELSRAIQERRRRNAAGDTGMSGDTDLATLRQERLDRLERERSSSDAPAALTEEDLFDGYTRSDIEESRDTRNDLLKENTELESLLDDLQTNASVDFAWRETLENSDYADRIEANVDEIATIDEEFAEHIRVLEELEELEAREAGAGGDSGGRALDRWYAAQDAADVDSFGATEARDLTDAELSEAIEDLTERNAAGDFGRSGPTDLRTLYNERNSRSRGDSDTSDDSGNDLPDASAASEELAEIRDRYDSDGEFIVEDMSDEDILRARELAEIGGWSNQRDRNGSERHPNMTAVEDEASDRMLDMTPEFRDAFNAYAEDGSLDLEAIETDALEGMRREMSDGGGPPWSTFRDELDNEIARRAGGGDGDGGGGTPDDSGNDLPDAPPDVSSYSDEELREFMRAGDYYWNRDGQSTSDEQSRAFIDAVNEEMAERGIVIDDEGDLGDPDADTPPDVSSYSDEELREFMRAGDYYWNRDGQSTSDEQSRAFIDAVNEEMAERGIVIDDDDSGSDSGGSDTLDTPGERNFADFEATQDNVYGLSDAELDAYEQYLDARYDEVEAILSDDEAPGDFDDLSNQLDELNRQTELIDGARATRGGGDSPFSGDDVGDSDSDGPSRFSPADFEGVTAENPGTRLEVFPAEDVGSTGSQPGTFEVWTVDEDGSRNGGRGSFDTEAEAQAYADATNHLTGLVDGSDPSIRGLSNDELRTALAEATATYGDRAFRPDLDGLSGDEKLALGRYRGLYAENDRRIREGLIEDVEVDGDAGDGGAGDAGGPAV